MVWLVSSLFGYFFTWGIPALWSLFLSIILYTIAGKLGWVRGVGRARTIQDAPEAADGTAAGSTPGPEAVASN